MRKDEQELYCLAMTAEIRPFSITKLPYTARFGLGSAEPVKRWSRFVLTEGGELYWTSAIYLRKDVDASNIHFSVHQSGEIFSSRYVGRGVKQGKVHSQKVSNMYVPFRKITRPQRVVSGEELLEPGYLYIGLRTLTEEDKRADIQNDFVACLDELLVNSRLRSSLDLVPCTSREEVIEYLSQQNQFFDINDPRCHVFIFCWESVSAVVTMRFTAGDRPIDIKQVTEAAKNRHPLKRLPFEETLSLSESTGLVIDVPSNFTKGASKDNSA